MNENKNQSVLFTYFKDNFYLDKLFSYIFAFKMFKVFIFCVKVCDLF